jgi:hypothetical protein
VTAARACRWAAFALVAIAIVDPRVPLPRRARPAISVVPGADQAKERALRERLQTAGFVANGVNEAAAVATADAAIDRVPTAPLFVVAPPVPDVAIQRVLASTVRVPGQAVAIAVTIRGRGANGRTTRLRLEDAGLTVAAASHRWTTEDETWQASLSYLPPTPAALSLRARVETPGDVDGGDDAADVLAPAERGPIRALVFAPAVTWPVVFLRRALEASPAFRVASLQRATKMAATRAGGPPATLTQADLEPYEVLVVGAMELDSSARETVRWFVEERGGVVIRAPDRAPTRDPLIAGVTFEPRVLDTPLTLTGAAAPLKASELAVPRGLPPLTQALAVDSAGSPIVFVVRRGLGAIVVSGALDAWRYREAEGFDRFWPAAILAHAIAAPPRLEITVTPAAVRPGDPVRILATLRGTELHADGAQLAVPPASAHAVAIASKLEVPLRLWPSAAPGRYEAEWRPPAAGDYAIDVSIGSLTGAAAITAHSSATARTGAADEAAVAARASGGGVFADEASLVQALASRFPPRMERRPVRPARSIWWAAAFAGLLCSEWALRRRRGLP